MKKLEIAAIEAVAKRYSGTWSKRDSGGACLMIKGRRIAVQVITTKARARVPDARLRFDRVAVGMITRLQANASGLVPDGRTVVVTVTAPIWKDSKTGVALESELRRLLAARQARLKTTINGNGIEVQVLRGGSDRTAKLIGFVHNPQPDPAVLFDVTRSLLRCIDPRERRRAGDLWLIIDNHDGLAPLRTYSHVCSALGARTFGRILVAHAGGRITSLDDGRSPPGKS